MYRLRLWRSDIRTLRGGLAVLLFLVLAAAALVLAGPALLGEESNGAQGGQTTHPEGWTPSYAQDVGPILQRACVQCHGTRQADKGLRLDSYQRMMAGDAYGTVVIPGDSSLSALISVVRYGTMPHGGTRLTAAEIETISRWIDSGAPEN